MKSWNFSDLSRQSRFLVHHWPDLRHVCLICNAILILTFLKGVPRSTKLKVFGSQGWFVFSKLSKSGKFLIKVRAVCINQTREWNPEMPERWNLNMISVIKMHWFLLYLLCKLCVMHLTFLICQKCFLKERYKTPKFDKILTQFVVTQNFQLSRFCALNRYPRFP